MKRKELSQKRQLYKEIPPARKKKPRSTVLISGVKGYVLDAGGKLGWDWLVPPVRMTDLLDQVIKEAEYLNASLRQMEKDLLRQARLEEAEKRHRPRGWAGLVEYVRETRDDKAEWVQEEIRKLQQEQLYGETEETRNQATRILSRLGNVLQGPGRGQLPKLSPEEREKRQKKSNKLSQWQARRHQYFQKWQVLYKNERERLRLIGGKGEANNQAAKNVIERILETGRKGTAKLLALKDLVEWLETEEEVTWDRKWRQSVQIFKEKLLSAKIPA